MHKLWKCPKLLGNSIMLLSKALRIAKYFHVDANVDKQDKLRHEKPKTPMILNQ